MAKSISFNLSVKNVGLPKTFGCLGFTAKNKHTSKRHSTSLKHFPSPNGFFSSLRINSLSEAMVTSITEAEDDECELVIGKELELGHEDDAFDAYLVEAVKTHNGAGILLLSDVEGHANADTRDFAYRLACFGFSVLVPDLFRGGAWEPSRDKSEYEAWRKEHTSERVAADIAVATKFLKEHLDEETRPLGPGKMGVLGFCYGGGRLIETLAVDKEDLFSAGVFFYGTRFDPSLGSSISAPLLLISGDSDPLCPTETIQQVEKNVPGSVSIVFSGRGHGFAHHPKCTEDDEDAEKAFALAKHWLQVHLLGEEAGSWVAS